MTYMRIRKFIKESKQVGLLYHVCNLDDYIKYIYSTDTLSASKKHTNWLYNSKEFISFTRDKNFVVQSYMISPSNIKIQLVIDGDKLSEKYKIVPYNDAAFHKFTGDRMDDSDEIHLREKEEAVKGPIKNISSYIKQVNFDFYEVNDSLISSLEQISSLEVVYSHFIRDYSKDRMTKSVKSSLSNGSNVLETIKTIKNEKQKKEYIEILSDGNVRLMEKALKDGADPNSVTEFGDPVIFYHCGLGMGSSYDRAYNAFKLLLDYGADPNSVTEFGDPVICVAAKNYCKKCVELLIKYGADINKTNAKGKTALDIASSLREDEAIDIVRLLSSEK